MQIGKKFVYIINIIVFLAVNNFLLKNFYIAHAQDYASTTVEVLVACGDGLMDVGEACDKGNPPDIPPDFGGATCADYGYESGNLVCNDDCTEILIDECYTCGNGIKEPVEQCDGSDFGGATCQTYGYGAGTLSCTADCLVNLMDCYTIPSEQSGNEQGEGGAVGGGSHGGGGAGYVGGRDTPLPETKVVIKGKAYPKVDVHILRDGSLQGIAPSDEQANFTYEDSDVTPGIASYGFWAEDKNKVRSALYTVSFRVTSNAITTLAGVYLPPSITVDRVTLKQGEDITIFGQTIPKANVLVFIQSDNEIQRQVLSDDDGEWTLFFNTAPLADNEQHLAKAYFQSEENGAQIQSGYSSTVTFFVGNQAPGTTCPGADLNKDGRVNLTDFSILLYNWGTDNTCADQNQNGKVDLADFSIMMFYWTG